MTTAVRLYVLLWPGIGPALAVAGAALLARFLSPVAHDTA